MKKAHSGLFQPFTTGTAKVTAGQTTVAVTHKLNTTPARVIISPTSDTLAGVRWWVSAKAHLTFTITISAAQASDITFDWHANTVEDKIT